MLSDIIQPILKGLVDKKPPKNGTIKKRQISEALNLS